MNLRIKTARKNKKLTQEQLANLIGISRNFITLIETGKETPSDRTIKDICRELEVSETWLRTGSGEMHPPKTREAEIADMVTKLYKENDPFKERLIAGLVNLDADKWTMIRDFVKYLVEIDDK